jgi:hypothetical protein
VFTTLKTVPGSRRSGDSAKSTHSNEKFLPPTKRPSPDGFIPESWEFDLTEGKLYEVHHPRFPTTSHWFVRYDEDDDEKVEYFTRQQVIDRFTPLEEEEFFGLSGRTAIWAR